MIAQNNIIDRFYPVSDIAQRYVIENWTTAKGLPQNSVNRIAQGAEGYLWLATNGGLVRFDGLNFTVFDLSSSPQIGSNRIIDIAISEDSTLWIAGEDGEFSYYKNDTFVNLSNKIRSAVNTNNIKIEQVIVDLNNSPWLLLTSGVLKLENKKIVYLPKEKFSGFENSLIHCSGNNTILVSHKNGIDIINRDNKISSIDDFRGFEVFSVLKISDNKFIAALDNILVEYDVSNGSLKKINGVPSNLFISAVFKDDDGKIWLASQNKGLWVHNGKRFTQFNFSAKHRSNVINIFEDKQNNIWIGTQAHGVFKIQRKLLYTIKFEDEYFSNIMYPIVQTTNGDIWSGSNCGGLARITPDDVKFYTMEDGLRGDCIWSITESRIPGKLYIGTYDNGISIWENNKFRNFEFSEILKNIPVFTIYEDDDLNLWVGTEYGLYKFSKNGFKLFTIEDGLPGQRITVIEKDFDETLWIGTSSGLCKIVDDSIVKTNYSTSKPENYIRSIKIERDNIWLTTYGGGIVYSDRSSFKFITKENGLFDNYVHTMVEDQFANYWMTTNQGIFRVSKTSLLDFVNNKINYFASFNYNSSSGILSDEFNGGMQPAFCELNDGTLLFPSLEGIVAVDRNNFKKNTIFPFVHIESFIVDDSIYTNNQSISIPSDFREIVIRYSAVDQIDPENLIFKYRLWGLDSEWSSIRKNRSVTFEHLPHGKYTFQVKARNSDGIWDNEGQSISFEVEAGFTETTLFQFITILIIVFVIVTIIKIRSLAHKKQSLKLEELVRVRTREEREQRQIAENLNSEKTEFMRIVTHNLKNPLGTIQNSGKFILENQDDPELISELSKIIEYASNHALNSISQLLLSSELEDKQFKLDKKEIVFNKIIMDVIESNKISSFKKKQKIEFLPKEEYIIFADPDKIIMAVDNYLSNAIKYSEPGKKIILQFTNLKDKIKFSVIDEGPGLTGDDLKSVFGKFKKLSAKPTSQESSTGLGLSIVKKIIELHNGKVGVESAAGKGSTFYFILPLK